jgi:methyl-accepting chemotaxis protein
LFYALVWTDSHGARDGAVVVLGVAWILYRSATQTEDANQWIHHTQEVYVQLETVLGTLVSAEPAVRQLPVDLGVRNPDALVRADGSIGSELDRLASLTADNPAQQERLQRFRAQASETLGLLHRLTDAKRLGAPTVGDDVERGALDEIRRIAQEMRAEETRLLGERVERDHGAVRRLQWTAATHAAGRQSGR